MKVSQTAWPDVLDHVQAAIRRALAEADARQQSPPPDATPPAARPGEESMRRFRERGQALDACAAGAVGGVAAADVELAAGEEALRAWIRAAEAARAKLADWAGRSVG